ncbi:MAG: glycine--tRNA ligase subunit beta [Cyanobacteria bacterium SZAS LIN-3]|nr:glycine--tRNA ligase subunit beta [Cyanobacteria bacterium SZAS LIN-3]
MANYLLELGVEELPAGFVPEVEERLVDLLKSGLEQANLKFESISSFSTPRRLTAVVKGLAQTQEATVKRVKGPPVKSSFSADGQPTVQATGFAAKHNLTVADLKQEDVSGTTFLIAEVTSPARKAGEVLPEIVEKIIPQLSGERPMRWGSCDLKFNRPLRWVVSLLGADVVPFDVAEITAGRTSFGHRILSPGPVEIKDADSYEEALKKASVMVDSKKRKELILAQVQAKAESLGGVAPQLSSSLLDEVTFLTEWPHALVGDFEADYLALPPTLIETIMIHHQRYFPLEEKAGASSGNGASLAFKRKLLPHFITVTNNDRAEAQAKIKQGNERVLRARLADGKFFFFDDRKTKLEDRRDALAKLTFQEGLGSYQDKTDRLNNLAKVLSDSLKLDPKLSVCLERTTELMKLDLVTNLVRELPELQGYVGSWYAESEGEPLDVAQAIASHYCPRSASDTIPADKVGQLAAVLDKIDHVVGLFALGRRPTGSSDPYSLRRNAQGLIDILVDGLTDQPVNLSMLINTLLLCFEPMLVSNGKKINTEAINADLQDMLLQRFRGKLLDMHLSREAVEAVLASRDPLIDLQDVVVRARTVDHLIGSPGATELIRAGVRIANILKGGQPAAVNESLLTEAVEKSLYEAFQKQVRSNWERDGHFTAPKTEGEYQSLLDLLRTLTPFVEKFFEDIMVNTEEQAVRQNRHALLANIDQYFKSVADFAKLQPVLN